MTDDDKPSTTNEASMTDDRPKRIDLTDTERSLVREVRNELINRAMRAERESGGGEIPMYPDAGEDDRAKAAAIRKLLGDEP